MSVFGVFLVQKTDQKNSEYGTFHAVCILSIKLHLPKDWATSKHKKKQQQKKKKKKMQNTCGQFYLSNYQKKFRFNYLKLQGVKH